MRKVILLMSAVVAGCVLMALAALHSSAFAQESGEQAKKEEAQKRKKKSTDVSFEDVLVQGKYHFSDEAVTTVEGDKVLDALLGVRTDFKDRLKKSASRH
jgi:hypothetical protein